MKLTQEEFAKLGGVKRVSQHLYEQDVRVPDLNYLRRLQQHKVDLTSLILDRSDLLGGSTVQEWVPILVDVFRAVDEFARDDSGDPLPLRDRERFFRFLCATLLSDASAADPEALKLRLANLMRGVA